MKKGYKDISKETIKIKTNKSVDKWINNIFFICEIGK